MKKLPAGIKLLVLMALTLRIFNAGFIESAVYFFAAWVLFFVSKVSFSVLKRLKVILWLAACMVLISALNQSKEMLYSDFLYILRFFTTSLFALCVFETSTRIQIMDALSALEKVITKVIPPFKMLHFALVLSITITFIPEIFSAWEKINRAALSRTPSKKGSPRLTVKSLNARFTALFLNMLEYAELVRRAVQNRI